MRRVALVLCLVSAFVTGMLTSPAGATFPGGNGRIVFYVEPDARGPASVATMEPDGTNRLRLAKAGRNRYPSWSADGTKIAYTRARLGLYTMNSDGTGKTLVVERTRRHDSMDHPSWSPDGTRLAFAAYARADGGNHIFVVNADGTGLVKIDTPKYGYPAYPDWSPDGSRIAFVFFLPKDVRIMTMDPDGSNPYDVTRGSYVSWSPDGSRIMFVGSRQDDVFIANADGSGRVRIADTAGIIESWPVLSPDGTMIAYSRWTVEGSRQVDIWMMKADGSSPVQVTDTPRRDEFAPSWQAT